MKIVGVVVSKSRKPLSITYDDTTSTVLHRYHTVLYEYRVGTGTTTSTRYDMSLGREVQNKSVILRHIHQGDSFNIDYLL